MSIVFLLFLLYIQFDINICDISSNCSLSFQVQTNKIQTDFPINLIGNYNLTCNIKNFIAYYKITPLSFLIIDKYKNENENIISMIELHTREFDFSINQSSTIRLCILSIDKNQICRQIHIGINYLYNFWNLPLKIFYICLICSISTYYILYNCFNKWCRNEHKSKIKILLSNENENVSVEE
jgi:predicted nucleic-acid-binding protein